MPLNFSGNITSGNQRLVVDVTNDPLGGRPAIRLRPPNGLEILGRKLANIFSFGAATRYFANPTQWEAFRNALAAEYRPGSPECGIPERYFDDVVSRYDSHQDLTRSKASNIIAELNSLREGKLYQSLPHDAPEHPEGLSQNWLARGVSSLHQRHRELSQKESELLTQAADPAVKPRNREAVRDILRPGRSISAASILRGQQAIKDLINEEQGHDFEFVSGGLQFFALSDLLHQVEQDGAQQIARLKESAERGDIAVLSIPYGLHDTSRILAEDHVVEIAVNFKTRQIFYLDSKAVPLDELSSKYPAQGTDFRRDLEEFGVRLFGEQFDRTHGVLELAHAKQQGACDCGPFTHAFTGAVARGVSPIELDTGVDASIRAEIRLDMCSDILTADLEDEHDAGAIPGMVGAGADFDPENAGVVELEDGGNVVGGENSNPVQVADPTTSLPPLRLDELGHYAEQIGVTLETAESLRQRFAQPPVPGAPGGFSVTEERVALKETEESAEQWKASIVPGTTMPRGILLESGPDELARLDELFNKDYLDSSQSVDTARSLFEVNGEQVPAELLLEKVTELARSHGITDQKNILRLYHSLDSEFSHAAPTEWMRLVNPGGGVFGPADSDTSDRISGSVRSIAPDPGKPGSFLLTSRIDRLAPELSLGRNEAEEITIRRFEEPSGEHFRYQTDVGARITFTQDSEDYPQTEHLYCRSLLTVEPNLP